MSEVINKAEYAKNIKERRIRQARGHYFTFLKLMSPPDFNWNWHHEYVCNILQEWITTDNFKHLMLFMPPQHQKTTMLVEFLVPWAFGKNVDYAILLLMANATMAKKQNRKIQRLMQRDIYNIVFPHVKLNEKNVVSTSKGAYVKNSEEFEIVGHRGFFKSVGVDGMIAGNPAKITLVDDIIKNQAQANSQTYRDSTGEWWDAELDSRQHNDSKIAATITRRHDDDQFGRLLKRDGLVENGGKWKVVILEAIKDTNTNPTDIRNNGEALFPQLHSLERLKEKQLKTPRIFESLYQQRPTIKGGDLIKGEHFKIMKLKECPFHWQAVTWNAWIDGAWTEKTHNDPTAVGYEYFDKVNKILYIRRIYDFRKKISDAIETFKTISTLYDINNRSLVNIETKASGEAFKDFLFKSGYNTCEIDNKTVLLGKMTRVEQSEPVLVSGRIVLIDEGADWIEKFIIQCEAFPNSKHDDMVDVVMYMIHKYFLNGSNPYIA